MFTHLDGSTEATVYHHAPNGVTFIKAGDEGNYYSVVNPDGIKSHLVVAGLDYLSCNCDAPLPCPHIVAVCLYEKAEYDEAMEREITMAEWENDFSTYEISLD